MDDRTSVSNAKAKFTQKRNVLLVMGGVMLILFVTLTYYLIKIQSHHMKNKIAKKETIKVSALSNDINDGSIALQRLEKKIEEYEKKFHQQESDEQIDVPANSHLTELEDKINLLEEKLNNMTLSSHDMPIKEISEEASKTFMQPTAFSDLPIVNQAKEYPELSDSYPVSPLPVGITIDSFKNTGGKPKKAVNYIPAGTYVKALLIQGIDASASISSQADPRPVLMRLVSNASLPNEVRSHIEDCRIIGAAYGDISSERAFIRLESMSCTLKSKDILENVIDGYVVGEDGKAGIRGIVVRREKELLANSFLSGLASGFGEGLSESFQRDLISPLGVVTQTKNEDIFKKGAAEGVSNSFDRLSKYYIDRAEQFQPVVQIGAGRVVEVVFKKGFHLQEGLRPLVLAQDK